ncbi:sensor histidine kinase [Thermincola potens]|uniref:histidine kinase n=1 Tax=Thermincola potens (strain JR) TaxID=635013 RepID=D5XCX4_THEPJ|nr:sensor histidine kinase [Thermincola potens]ADG83650.1 Histidine kinase [Thermincola potens JR]
MVELAINGSKSDISNLDKIVKDTIFSIENGKEQIFAIAENARIEYLRMKTHLDEVNDQLVELAKEIEKVREDERVAQYELGEIDRNFQQYKEADIKRAYEHASKMQAYLSSLLERESLLKQKKKDYEASLVKLQETAMKADNLMSQVGVVMDFIGGNLKNLNLRLESLQQKQQMGIEIIRAQEEERKRVAREIHDGPAQSMANLVLRMEYCEKLMDVAPEQVRAELGQIKEAVKLTLQDVRKIIFDLRPMALDDLGIVPAVKRYLEDYKSKSGIEVNANFFGREARYTPALEIAIFRLIQEGLNNVRKHARAGRVNLTIDVNDKFFTICIRDNGVGFDLEQVMMNNKGNKFGLINMRERVALLGGEMKITTAPKQGTELYFKIPVAGQEVQAVGEN